jgi:hypothetical protein
MWDKDVHLSILPQRYCSCRWPSYSIVVDRKGNRMWVLCKAMFGRWSRCNAWCRAHAGAKSVC